MSVRLVEKVTAPFAGCRVDRQTGVIRNVLLCGAESKNGRSYGASLWPKSIAKYEGAPIHADHGRERRVGDRIGWISNARVVDGRPRGDANFLTSHPLVPPILEAAERRPSLFGFSHVALADTRRVNGRETVESISKIEAVDLVADPATVAGLYESVQRGQAMTSATKTSATRLLESLQATAPAGLRGSLRKVLVELDLKDHRDATTRAFEQAGHATWTAFIEGEIGEDDMLAKFRKLAKGHRDAGGSGDTSGTPALEGRVPVGSAFAESLRGMSDPAAHARFVEHITGRVGDERLKEFARVIRS